MIVVHVEHLAIRSRIDNSTDGTTTALSFQKLSVAVWGESVQRETILPNNVLASFPVPYVIPIQTTFRLAVPQKAGFTWKFPCLPMPHVSSVGTGGGLPFVRSPPLDRLADQHHAIFSYTKNDAKPS